MTSVLLCMRSAISAPTVYLELSLGLRLAGCHHSSLRASHTWVPPPPSLHTQVKGILEEYRIGRLKGGASAAAVADPYAAEPTRLPALIVRSQKPMNAGGVGPEDGREGGVCAFVGRYACATDVTGWRIRTRV